MPLFPRTAKCDPARFAPLPARLGPTTDPEIRAVIDLVVNATVSPPAGQVLALTLKLRRFLHERVPRIREVADRLLPVDDPRRLAAEKCADEATYRVWYVKPAGGLEAEFRYCLGLARIAEELLDHQCRLAQGTASQP
ncbi:hypothetical protein GCM10010218_04630 [Streptomyces mashuensis]|uniref:Uncharacterized protein n=1 Tax=Streptomyces mashuensis TaxID=33904 RepID=A0A919AWK1_9ACTN|nr:DUF6415 family natural product biosynthesis protein [Streptomyces mashuensis]GHF26782.1 hypothetical protein GCM10010218_04630 [Streptomyces mashuensis]